MRAKLFILIAMPFLGMAFFYSASHASLFGGGGSDQITPDIAKAGSPTIIRFVVGTYGVGGPIAGRYKDIVLHYRLVDEKDYEAIQPKPVDLPDNYKKSVAAGGHQYEAYEFTMPPYPAGATGKIEYYIDMSFDGYPNTAKGYKTIKLISSP